MTTAGKFAICIFYVLSALCSLEAQDKSETYYGVKAGVNFATLNGENAALPVGGNLLEPSSKISLVAGAFILYEPWEKFGVQPEFLISMKGVNFEADTYLHSWSLWYIEIPVLFKSLFEMRDQTSGSFFAGPAISYKIKSTWSEKYKDTYSNEDEQLAGLNNFDFSAVIGASMEMNALGGRLGLDLRYTYGLISIQEIVSVQNGAISMSLYYQFNNKSRRR